MDGKWMGNGLKKDGKWMEMVNDMEVSNLFERADQDDDLFE